MRRLAIMLVPFGALSLSAFGATAMQDVSNDVRDLVGARAAGGEHQLETRGFVHISTQTGTDRKWSNWWHADTGRCITVQTYDGRYASIVSTLPADCGFSTDAAATAPGYQQPGNAYPPDDDYRERNIHLTCFGEGKKPQVRTYPVMRWDKREHEFDTTYINALQRSEFDSMVQVDIRGDRAAIWLPKDLQPPIHSGGDHGWWDIRDLRVRGGKVTGNYRLNGLNHPKVDIDLSRGTIHIKGQRDFRGTCERIGS